MGKVYTESSCSMCGLQVREEGASADFPPITWSGLSLTKRLPGSGWTQSQTLLMGEVCSTCAVAIVSFVLSRKGSKPAS